MKNLGVTQWEHFNQSGLRHAYNICTHGGFPSRRSPQCGFPSKRIYAMWISVKAYIRNVDFRQCVKLFLCIVHKNFKNMLTSVMFMIYVIWILNTKIMLKMKFLETFSMKFLERVPVYWFWFVKDELFRSFYYDFYTTAWA
jgi:hypothetical protein